MGKFFEKTAKIWGATPQKFHATDRKKLHRERMSNYEAYLHAKAKEPKSNITLATLGGAAIGAGIMAPLSVAAKSAYPSVMAGVLGGGLGLLSKIEDAHNISKAKKILAIRDRNTKRKEIESALNYDYNVTNNPPVFIMI